uniref:Nodulation protein G n=1 Tax=Rhizobium meliloti TaxID=382 RepID=NODG_RHIML|nr:RecName: Full=Nodulation protein G; AltName: Full=Host-specificity of nodulation protein C [Sinorhizobium meliloti]AAA26288.1 host-specificity of modulation protein C [Sinorhizobium meliloti]
MFELTGRKALVTGASGAIGGAIARVLHAQGAIVGLHGTQMKNWRHWQLSLETGSSCSRLIWPIETKSRRLVRERKPILKASTSWSTNAGITKDGLFLHMADPDWDIVLEVNLTAMFRLTREITQQMIRRRNGRIINVTSVAGAIGNPGQTNYCASKAGMIGFSKSWRRRSTRNITVNCVAPGFIESAMTDKLNHKQKEKIMVAIPIHRMGTGTEVASAVAYLASDHAAYVTGQTIHVNGGMAMI